nr:hypothetical protein [uncultured Desulfobacter sp.]
MVEPWSYINVDLAGVQDAKNYRRAIEGQNAIIAQANVEIEKGNRAIRNLKKRVAELESKKDEYLVDIRTLNEVLRSYVNEGVIDIEDARSRRDQIRITELAEFKANK